MFTHHIRRRAVRGVLTAVLAVALAACGDSTGPEDSPVGSYTLVSIDGSSLPVVIFELGPDKFEITSGTMTINANQTFSTNMTWRETLSGSTMTGSESDSGTWSRSSSSLTLSFSDGSSDSASWSGNTITVTADGIVFVFER